MIDHEYLPENSQQFDKQHVLSSLLRHDLVIAYRYSDQGPPPEVESFTSTWSNEEVYPGWAILGPPIPRTPSWTGRSIRYSNSVTTESMSGIMGNFAEVARSDTTTAAYQELSASEAADRRESDSLAAQVAESVGADLFVTDRPYLHRLHGRLNLGVTYCTLDEALAVVGLYLRSQNVFALNGPPGTFTYNKGLYYWVGTRELLPEAWRWFSACVQHSSSSTSDDELTYLAGSLLQRVERSLWARDDLHRAYNQKHNNDTGDSVLEAFDRVTLQLLSALDVSARVAHFVLGLTGSRNQAGWQNEKRWLKQVHKQAPELAELVAAGTDHRAVLDILVPLRNSIHGEALHNMAYQKAGTERRNVMGLPKIQEALILKAMDQLGGRGSWGVEALLPDRVFVDSAMLLEQLLPRVLCLLNDVMRLTPVEALTGVQLTQEQCGPPTGSPATNSFSAEARQSIRWQLGL